MTQNQQPATRRSLYEITGNVSDLNTVLMGQDTLNALEDERDRFRDAFNEWADKTDWARKTTQPHELGKHLADVLRERIEKFQAENATLQAGYSAARLEIESLRARGVGPDVSGYVSEWSGGLCTSDEAMDGIAKLYAAQPAGAQHPGSAYVAPEVLDALNWVDDFIARCNGDDRGACESVDVLRRAFASHGQAPAQAAPAAVAGPSEAVAYLDIGAGGYLDLGTDLSNEALSRLPKGRHALVIAGTYGIDGYTAAPNTQPAPDEREAFEAWYIDQVRSKTSVPNDWSDDDIRGVWLSCPSDAYRSSWAGQSWEAWKARAARAPADSVTAQAGRAVVHTLSDAQIEAMPVWRNFVGLWPESRREIVDAVVDLLAAAPTPPTQAADSVLEDAARLERERICAAIKAEDDYCVDQGNYMLDSDDCIKIVRGEWVRPNFAIDAARAAQEGKA